jgi:hypothetical protein
MTRQSQYTGFHIGHDRARRYMAHLQYWRKLHETVNIKDHPCYREHVSWVRIESFLPDYKL